MLKSEAIRNEGPVLSIPEELVGTWHCHSTGSNSHIRAEYLWKLELGSAGKLFLELTNSESMLIHYFTGYWSVDEQTLTLHTKQKGAFLFPFATLDLDFDGEYMGYSGRILRHENSEIEIFFGCVDLAGGDHILIAEMVEQDAAPQIRPRW